MAALRSADLLCGVYSMANGFSGSKEDWRKLELALLEIDPTLEAFADRHQLSLSKNHKSPERSLSWADPVHRLIQIYVGDEKRLTYDLWLCASEDRENERYWKTEFLLKDVPANQLAHGLRQNLERGRELLQSWSSEDLQLATVLRSS